MRLVMACLLLLPVVAEGGGMFELPTGKWRHDRKGEGDSDVCLEVVSKDALRLSFQTGNDRNPVLVDGSYTVTATKMGSYNFTLVVGKIATKVLSKCRKYWVDEELAETQRMGTRLAPGAKLKLTLNFSSCGNKAQLCHHPETINREPDDGFPTSRRASPSIGVAKVWCQELEAETPRECHEGPAIDGAKINAPVTR